MNCKLEDEVMEERVTKVRVRPALYASKRENCGGIFRMKDPKNGNRGIRNGTLSGYFSKDAIRTDGTGIGLGDRFSATVCSFECANTLYMGGWEFLPQYKPFVLVGATLIKIELTLSMPVEDEAAIRKEWMEETLQPNQPTQQEIYQAFSKRAPGISFPRHEDHDDDDDGHPGVPCKG